MASTTTSSTSSSSASSSSTTSSSSTSSTQEQQKKAQREYILGMYDIDNKINKVYINYTIVPGNSLEDCDNMCSEHGLCQNYMCYCYENYTKNDCSKTVSHAEKGTEVKYVLAVVGALFLIFFILSCIINFIFKKPLEKKEYINDLSDDD